MHRIFRVKAYEKEHGPHFNEEYARKAVMKMENEDGTRGPHWSLEETTTLASQYGIVLGSKFYGSTTYEIDVTTEYVECNERG